jgi:hypothetical protein
MKIRYMLIVCCLFGAVPVDSGALTVEEILLLKQNGVSEQTIQMMLHSELQGTRSADSGEEEMGVRTIIRPGGRSAIVYTTGRGGQSTRDAEEHLKEERAWEMLRHLIVDTRKTDIRGPRSDAGNSD